MKWRSAAVGLLHAPAYDQGELAQSLTGPNPRQGNNGLQGRATNLAASHAESHAPAPGIRGLA